MANLAYQVTGFAYQGAGQFAYQGSTDTAPVSPSGGYYEPKRKRRTPEELRRDREIYGIPQRDAEIIEDVAAQQAELLRLDEQQRNQQLREELRLSGIEMESRHLAALADARQRMIDAEIGIRLHQRMEAMRRQEDEVKMLVMLAALI